MIRILNAAVVWSQRKPVYFGVLRFAESATRVVQMGEHTTTSTMKDRNSNKRNVSPRCSMGSTAIRVAFGFSFAIACSDDIPAEDSADRTTDTPNIDVDKDDGTGGDSATGADDDVDAAAAIGAHLTKRKFYRCAQLDAKYMMVVRSPSTANTDMPIIKGTFFSAQPCPSWPVEMSTDALSSDLFFPDMMFPSAMPISGIGPSTRRRRCRRRIDPSPTSGCLGLVSLADDEFRRVL